MKKIILFVCLSLLASIQSRAQDYTLTRSMPGIIFGYPSDVPLINDQSQIATVVWPNLAEVNYMGQYTILAIDGVAISRSIRNSPFRRHDAPCFAIDLLPGKHTLSVSYLEYIGIAGQGKKTYKVSTPAPIDVSAEFEAGCVYQLKAHISNGVFTGFSLDRELTDQTIVSRLAQSRTASRMAFTPLAAGETTAPPQRPAGRRTVQPAAPRQSPAAVASSQPSGSPTVTPTPAEPLAAPAAIESLAELSDSTALLHIYRVGRMGGAAIGYDVYLGNEVVYRARNNSKTTIRLTGSGMVSLWGKTESRIDLPLGIEPGREYWIRCGLKMGAMVGRPVLEIVDAEIGKTEFEKIPANRQEAPRAAPIAIGIPVSTAALKPTQVESAIMPETPVAQEIETPDPPTVPAGADNGTLVMISIAIPDSVVFRPSSGVEFPASQLSVSFVSGTQRFNPEYLQVSGTFRIGGADLSKSLDFNNAIYTDKTRVIAKLSGMPADFRPLQIVFTVSGKEMTYDISRSEWVVVLEEPVPDPVAIPAANPEPEPEPMVWDASSSGWEGENFTAIFELNGPGSGYAYGTWQFEFKPPFPHAITGLDDSYVQTALGILLLGMEPAGGVSWLLRAAKKDQIDAIMMLAIAYANTPEVKDAAESERWFRRAIELGNTEAESKLNDLLAGIAVGKSFKSSVGYSFGFKRLP